jgi:hypothetical protein
VIISTYCRAESILQARKLVSGGVKGFTNTGKVLKAFTVGLNTV